MSQRSARIAQIGVAVLTFSAGLWLLGDLLLAGGEQCLMTLAIPDDQRLERLDQQLAEQRQAVAEIEAARFDGRKWPRRIAEEKRELK